MHGCHRGCMWCRHLDSAGTHPSTNARWHAAASLHQGCRAHSRRTSQRPPYETCLTSMLTRQAGMQHSHRTMGAASAASVHMCRCMLRSAGRGQQCLAVHPCQLHSGVTAVLTETTAHSRPVSLSEPGQCMGEAWKRGGASMDPCSHRASGSQRQQRSV